MNERELFYRQWIEDIATYLGTRPDGPLGILEHIQKHAGPDLLGHLRRGPEGGADWLNWSASMHNLLAIFDAMYLGTVPNVETKLARLQRHYDTHPNRTPPPKGFDGLGSSVREP